MPKADEPTLVNLMPGHLIRRLHQISTQIFTTQMNAVGCDLTSVQFAALDAIKASPGLDQASLADKIAKDRVTVGAVVDRLLRKGLIERAINEADKRARILHLSAEGETLLEHIRPIVSQLQRDILSPLSEDEYQIFLALADKASKSR